MPSKRKKHLVPLFIAVGAIGVSCVIAAVSGSSSTVDLLNRLEWISYDWRVRWAAESHPSPASTNLAAVYIDAETVGMLSEGNLGGLQANFPFPRHIYGRVVRELAAQGARAVAFDVMFAERRAMDPVVIQEDGTLEGSDEYFLRQMTAADNVIIAAGSDSHPHELFRQPGVDVADISANSDEDGVLRRVTPFVDDPVHGRRWHMGIELAARELDLNLGAARAERSGLAIPSTSGGKEVFIPLDRDGMFLIDWGLAWNDPRLLQTSFGMVLMLDYARSEGGDEFVVEVLDAYREEGLALEGEKPFEGKLVVIGSVVEGNNLTDIGVTPLSKRTYLVSKHWNVANTLIQGAWIKQPGLGVELMLVAVMGALVGLIHWRSGVAGGVLWTIVLGGVYVAIAVALFNARRIWLPVVTPAGVGLVVPFLSIFSYRLIFEQRERRRVKSVFAKIVSPNVVNELLDAETLALGGARRSVSVFFADVRGFTGMTDKFQEDADAHVRDHRLEGAAAERHYDEQAKEVLATVNQYLAAIADVIKKHDGTLDKYIGDCVMAFWGAPTPNEQHAVACVKAAIESQRAIYKLNQARAEENKRRKERNAQGGPDGEPVLPMLPLLSLGTGINSGEVIVGLMGSDQHILNYTVFGRDVNLASRLEAVSGRGRIIIGKATYLQLEKYAPELAAVCVKQPDATVKGFREAQETYEVPWKEIDGSGTSPSPSGGGGGPA